MGFDLYMIDEPDATEASGYWRGLGGVVEAMNLAGVLDTECEPPEIDVEWPPEDMDEDRAEEIFLHLRDGEALDLPVTEAEMRAGQAFLAACRATEQSRSPDPNKVPAYKFDGNDGMHVVPEECALIAAALEQLLENPPEDLVKTCEWDDDEDNLLEWIEDWKDYNRVAATHGGYRVC